MKASVIPAQITNHEDTITGNLTLTQLILLVAPVFLSAVIFALIPPIMKVTADKVVILLLLGLPIVLLALRVKERLLVNWLALIARYLLMPHIYLRSIEDENACECSQSNEEVTQGMQIQDSQDNIKPISIHPSLAEVSFMDRALVNRKIKYFTDKEGSINAIID